MGALVSDEMLDAYAAIALPQELPDKLSKRFGEQVNRIQIDETWFDGLSDSEISYPGQPLSNSLIYL